MKTPLADQRNRALTKMDVLVIIAVLAVLAALLLPALMAANHGAKRINCLSNLKQIGIAFRLWEADNNQYPMAVSVTNGGAMEWVATGNVAACFQVMSNELSTPKILVCPADRKRTIATGFGTGFGTGNISYFLNAAAKTNPQTVLAGDANLTVDGVPVQSGIVNLGTNSRIGWTKERNHGMGYSLNIVMADCSLQQVTSNGLNTVLADSVATNRWLIP
jgi:hypothetical protein